MTDFGKLNKLQTRNLAIANRSRVSCAPKITTVLKWPSKVTQGHWRFHGSIEHIWFPIAVLQ